MDDIFWEIKAPQSNGKHTIEHAFRKALKQSENIIFDLRRSKMLDSKCISQLTKHFKDMKKIKRLLIITNQKAYPLLNSLGYAFFLFAKNRIIDNGHQGDVHHLIKKLQ